MSDPNAPPPPRPLLGFEAAVRVGSHTCSFKLGGCGRGHDNDPPGNRAALNNGDGGDFPGHNPGGPSLIQRSNRNGDPPNGPSGSGSQNGPQPPANACGRTQGGSPTLGVAWVGMRNTAPLLPSSVDAGQGSSTSRIPKGTIDLTGSGGSGQITDDLMGMPETEQLIPSTSAGPTDLPSTSAGTQNSSRPAPINASTVPSVTQPDLKTSIRDILDSPVGLSSNLSKGRFIFDAPSQPKTPTQKQVGLVGTSNPNPTSQSSQPQPPLRPISNLGTTTKTLSSPASGMTPHLRSSLRPCPPLKGMPVVPSPKSANRKRPALMPDQDGDGNDKNSAPLPAQKKSNTNSSASNNASSPSKPGPSSSKPGTKSSEPVLPKPAIHLSDPRMFTVPPVDQLNRIIASSGSYTVRNVIVGHLDFGSVHFLGFRNLRSLEGTEGVIDLSSHVIFHHGGVQIQNAATTPLSDGPMLITLSNITREQFAGLLEEQDTTTPISDETLHGLATRLAQGMNATFGQFNEPEGTWIILVDEQPRATPSGHLNYAEFPGPGGHSSYFS